ncbi:hypothetical protein TSUD_337700 [Trifolium subterraneum]|uniref:Reverse transcriptase zinc-binding domain-containing protein n=1 Tax=Trifolium subterraneum TaxID=3900 RepID=A0A2Z6LT07_TRISU|nr:hypothetical protein TSUD_337700 [Trifolium subterraneum]
MCTVAEMCSLGWGADGEAWVWRMQLRVWEEEILGECQSLLLNLSLQILTSHDSATTDDAEKLIWHSQVPLNVFILAWRLLRDRLPTKANLVTRGILSPTAHLCVSDCGEVETTHHLFISCSTFGFLWTSVRSWVGITLVESTSLRDHFVQFTYSTDGSWARRPFLQLI